MAARQRSRDTAWLATAGILLAIILAVVASQGRETAESNGAATVRRTSPTDRSASAETDSQLAAPTDLDPTRPDRTTTHGASIEGAPPSDAPRSVEVSATDALTGARIARFWIEPDAFGELATEQPRIASDPATGLAVLQRDDPPSILVHAPGYATASVPLERPRTRARLTRTPGIEGRVLGASNAPARAARVTLEFLGPLEQPPAETAQETPPRFRGATLRRTNEDGRFLFTDLVPGHWRTRATAGTSSQVSPPLRVDEGAWTTSQHWLDGHVRLVVTVTRPDGLPSPRTRVNLSPWPVVQLAEFATHAYTDERGEATLGPLSSMAYRLTLISDDGSAEPIEFTVSDASPSLLARSVTLRATTADDGR